MAHAIQIEAGWRPGCIGRIAQLHAHYYAAAAGFGLAFEALVARELGEFCERIATSGADDAGRLWLAVGEGGQIEGSIAIDGVHARHEGAHLRWFILSEAVRGRGLGRRLIGQALGYVDRHAWPRTYLWTFAGLDAARHLYEANGFRLKAQQAGARWGKAVTEQRFEREHQAP